MFSDIELDHSFNRRQHVTKKHATRKSSTPTLRPKTEQALAKAVIRANDPALLRQIAKTRRKMECLAIDPQAIPLAVAILKGRETRILVDWLAEANEEVEIADILGTLIAATRMSGRV
jgi:hypothetical protein